MGRTLPSVTQAFMLEQENFSRFRRALRRGDQLALDDIFAMARKHVAAAAYAANALPMETMLLAMLLEEHKEVMRLREIVEALEKQMRKALPPVEQAEAAPEDAAHPSEN